MKRILALPHALASGCRVVKQTSVEKSDQAHKLLLQDVGIESSAADSDAALEAGNTPLEDHIAQDSPLQRMARDTRRIDSMQHGFVSKAGTVSSVSFSNLICRLLLRFPPESIAHQSRA